MPAGVPGRTAYSPRASGCHDRTILDAAIVLDLPFDVSSLTTVEAALATLEESLGRVFEGGVGEPAQEGVRIWIWTDVMEPSLQVRLVADRHYRIQCLLVYGPHREDVIAALKSTLPLWRDDADADDDASFYRRALLAVGYSASLHRQIAARLGSPDPGRRALAAECVRFLRWPELAGDIDDAVRVEKDADVREMFRVLALAIKRDPAESETEDHLVHAAARRFARARAQDFVASLARLDALVSGNDWDAALVLGRALQASAPERFEPWEAIALSCTFTLRHEEAIEAYEAALARYSPAPTHLGPAVAAVVGDRRKGRLLFNLACEYARAGDIDRALGRLAEAIESSPTGHWRREAEGDAYLDGIRADPRFVAMMRGR